MLQDKFRKSQQSFDREYRKEKRKYQWDKINELEQLDTTNPRKFWQEVKRLGPRSGSYIPMSVYDDGYLTPDPELVLNKWKNDFNSLYNATPCPGTFDEEFLRITKEGLLALEIGPVETVFLNGDIMESEIRKALNKAKCGKAVGIDSLPNEVLKNNVSVNLLQSLFSKIFVSNMVPSTWRKALIKPIPKSSLLDPHTPLNYRGISLLSTVYKLYTSILNNRLLTYAENNIYHDEQNGFRPRRSCTDHLYVLTTILRHRINQNKDTYVCYIDAEKAFDRVNRNLLFHKLLQYGVNGKFYDSLKNLYSDNISCVNINGHLTEWFNVGMGVRQGDTLSPTLFGIYVNDMIDEIKSLGMGIPLGDTKISTLFYADDVVVMAESASDLQNMLDKISQWGYKWHIKFNSKKSQIVHYRKKRKIVTNFRFSLNHQELAIVDHYKYLGIVLHENLNFDVTSETLAGAGGRALGSLLSKFRKLNGLTYNTFTKLYKSYICPILDYGSEIWGIGRHAKIDQIQNRAIRAYLGVHRFAPTPGLEGDMGWTRSLTRRQINRIRYWNHLLKLNEDRLTKIVFNWDREQLSQGWASDMKELFIHLGQNEIYDRVLTLSLEQAWACLHEKECQTWVSQIENMPKLRTYRIFKKQYKVEEYVHLKNRKHRSLLSQIRFGILPIEIETGRWRNIEAENRLCKLCISDRVEDESHFMFECPMFTELRSNFLNDIESSPEQIALMSMPEKWELVMSPVNIAKTAKYVCVTFEKRRSLMFV